MGTTPGRLDATTVPRVSSWNSFSFSCLCLGIFLWWCPSPLIRFALRNPWILTPFLLTALQPEISQATFFWQTFSCFTHFLTLFILPISALPTLVISLIWALLSSSHLPLPYFRYFPLRISRLFPFPAFFIRRFLTSPFFHFPTLFHFLASSGSNVASDLGNQDSALGSKSLESWIYGWRSLGLWNLWCKGFRVHGFRVKRN